MQAQIAFPGHRHAQRPVGKHLDAYQFPLRTPQIFLHNLPVDFCNLLQCHLPRQNHNIRILRKKTKSLDIRHIALRADMHLYPHRTGIQYRRQIRSNYCRQASLLGTIYHLPHLFQLIVIYHSIHRQIGFHPMLRTYRHNLTQIPQCEIGRRTGTHIQSLHSEIHRIRTALQSRVQGLV